mmetsp:Transcript_23852/g.67104  ORF Transcript_23852/g.67104 Transcript_23852/m.67104 type:complete len:221 (+) Transcript_23852:1153-1815(+)
MARVVRGLVLVRGVIFRLGTPPLRSVAPPAERVVHGDAHEASAHLRMSRRHDFGHLPAEPDALEVRQDYDAVFAARTRRALAGTNFAERGLHRVEADGPPVQSHLEAPGPVLDAAAEVVVLLERRVVIVRRPSHLERHPGRLVEVGIAARRRGRRDTIAIQHHEAAVANFARRLGLLSIVVPARGRDGGREQPARPKVRYDVLVNRGHDDALQSVLSHVP